MASKSLYVGNLPFTTSEQELRDLFAQWGPTDIRLIGDKGFGFVDVPEESADEAIEQINGKDFNGRTLRVNEARPRGEAPPRRRNFRSRDRGDYGGDSRW